EYESVFSQFGTDGQPGMQDVWMPNQADWQIHDNLPVHFVGFDQWQVKNNEGTRSQKGNPNTTRGTVYETYDANGYTQSVDGNLADNEGRRWLRTNAEGRIVYKQSTNGKEYFFYDPMGVVLG